MRKQSWCLTKGSTSPENYWVIFFCLLYMILTAVKWSAMTSVKAVLINIVTIMQVCNHKVNGLNSCSTFLIASITLSLKHTRTVMVMGSLDSLEASGLIVFCCAQFNLHGQCSPLQSTSFPADNCLQQQKHQRNRTLCSCWTQCSI